MELFRPSGIKLTDPDLAALYAFPKGPWLRANFVETLDGAGAGPDNRTGSINTKPDNRVFALNRRLCDAVVVGAGTARAEGYQRIVCEDGQAPALVIISHSGRLPEGIGEPSFHRGKVIFITREQADPKELTHADKVLGDESVWIVGGEHVDLTAAMARLRVAGLPHLLAEGGPSLFTDLLKAGLVDDLALTLVPKLIGGSLIRITGPHDLDIDLDLVSLLEENGTLLGLWRIKR